MAWSVIAAISVMLWQNISDCFMSVLYQMTLISLHVVKERKSSFKCHFGYGKCFEREGETENERLSYFIEVIC